MSRHLYWSVALLNPCRSICWFYFIDLHVLLIPPLNLQAHLLSSYTERRCRVRGSQIWDNIMKFQPGKIYIYIYHQQIQFQDIAVVQFVVLFDEAYTRKQDVLYILSMVMHPFTYTECANQSTLLLKACSMDQSMFVLGPACLKGNLRCYQSCNHLRKKYKLCCTYWVSGNLSYIKTIHFR